MSISSSRVYKAKGSSNLLTFNAGDWRASMKGMRLIFGESAREAPVAAIEPEAGPKEQFNALLKVAANPK
jgi:hypothetical protein